MIDKLSFAEQDTLLVVAREAILFSTQNKKLPRFNLNDYSKNLKENGASFVTLHTRNDNKLRGCIGSLEAYQPLILDVQVHAVAAAMEDYRFPSVKFEEVDNLHIEISRLTPPIPIKYTNPTELPGLLRIGIDGVIIQDGFKRATFLPQVWQQLPDPDLFLSHLCSKMGVSSKLWQTKLLEVSIYEVEEFHE